MKNPIAGRNLVAFGLYWLMLALLWGGFTRFFYNFPLKILVFDALFSFGLLACVFISLWQTIRFFKPQLTSWATVFVNHFVLVSIVLVIWSRVCIGVVDLIFNPGHVYFTSAIPLKIVLSVFSYVLYVLLVQVHESQQQHEKQKETELKLTTHLKEAELAVLRNQLNPHFLFNSLNSINSLILIDPEKARQMVIKLSDFLRYNVANTQTQKVTLQKELEMSEAFLEIEKIRFGSRITIEMDIDTETRYLLMPSLLLQPLFENALKYGLYDSTDRERIEFKTSTIENRLVLEMTNSFDDSLPTKVGTKSGLKNIKERLKLMYADHATLTTQTKENLFTVKVFIPLEK